MDEGISQSGKFEFPSMSKFDGAIEVYLALRSEETQRQYKHIIAEWLSFCGSEQAAFESDIASVWGFVGELKKGKGQRSRFNDSDSITWGTIQRKLIVLKAIYDHLMKLRLVTNNPFDDEQFTKRIHSRPKRPTEQVSFSDVQRLIGLPGQLTKKGIRDTCILTLLFACGLRRSEVVAIELRDIQKTKLGTVFIKIREQKNSQVTDQALPEWAHEIVLKTAEIRIKEGAHTHHPLITHYRTEREIATNDPLDDKTIYRYFKKYCSIAKLPSTLTPHSARATAVTKLLEDGLSYREVQEFSRHSSVQMVEVYDKRHFSIERSPAKKLKY